MTIGVLLVSYSSPEGVACERHAVVSLLVRSIREMRSSVRTGHS